MTRAIDDRKPTTFREIHAALMSEANPTSLPAPSPDPEVLVLILQHEGRTLRAEFHPDRPWQLSLAAGPVMLQEVTLPEGALVEALLAVQRAYTVLRNVSEDKEA